jgi:Fur family peroxide stress response transcriptional regulator
MGNIEGFIDALREKGLNVTYQRILIFKHLVQAKTHPTAEEIYNEVKSEYSSISMATVYKTLETFAEHNLINKVNALHDMARFDGDTTPHHHLICLNCKKIVDIYNDALNNLPTPSNKNFIVLGYQVQFEGICENCELNPAKQSTSAEDERPLTFCGKQKN